MTRQKHFLPTIEEVVGGVYIDFEANVDHDPTVLGVLVKNTAGTEVWEQHVIEDNFAPAAKAWPLGGKGHCVESTPDAAIKRVLELTEGNRAVFAYGASHEKTLVEAIPGGEALVPLISDVLPWSKFWKKEKHPKAVFEKEPGFGLNQLRKMANLAGMGFPPFLGHHKVGPNLTKVRNQLQSKRRLWVDVSPGAKKAWSKVLTKNEWDCRTTRALLVRIVTDLDTSK